MVGSVAPKTNAFGRTEPYAEDRGAAASGSKTFEAERLVVLSMDSLLQFGPMVGDFDIMVGDFEIEMYVSREDARLAVWSMTLSALVTVEFLDTSV